MWWPSTNFLYSFVRYIFLPTSRCEIEKRGGRGKWRENSMSSLVLYYNYNYLVHNILCVWRSLGVVRWMSKHVEYCCCRLNFLIRILISAIHFKNWCGVCLNVCTDSHAIEPFHRAAHKNIPDEQWEERARESTQCNPPFIKFMLCLYYYLLAELAYEIKSKNKAAEQIENLKFIWISWKAKSSAWEVGESMRWKTSKIFYQTSFILNEMNFLWLWQLIVNISFQFSPL